MLLCFFYCSNAQAQTATHSCGASYYTGDYTAPGYGQDTFTDNILCNTVTMGMLDGADAASLTEGTTYYDADTNSYRFINDDPYATQFAKATIALNAAFQQAGLGLEIRGWKYEYKVYKSAGAELMFKMEIKDGDSTIYSASVDYTNYGELDGYQDSIDNPPPYRVNSLDTYEIIATMTGDTAGDGIGDLEFIMVYRTTETTDTFDPNYLYPGQTAPDTSGNTSSNTSEFDQQCQVDPQFNPTCPGYEYDDGTETGSDDGTQTANNGENTETFDNTTTASDALNEGLAGLDTSGGNGNNTDSSGPALSVNNEGTVLIATQTDVIISEENQGLDTTITSGSDDGQTANDGSDIFDTTVPTGLSGDQSAGTIAVITDPIDMNTSPDLTTGDSVADINTVDLTTVDITQLDTKIEQMEQQQQPISAITEQLNEGIDVQATTGVDIEQSSGVDIEQTTGVELNDPEPLPQEIAVQDAGPKNATQLNEEQVILEQEVLLAETIEVIQELDTAKVLKEEPVEEIAEEVLVDVASVDDVDVEEVAEIVEEAKPALSSKQRRTLSAAATVARVAENIAQDNAASSLATSGDNNTNSGNFEVSSNDGASQNSSGASTNNSNSSTGTNLGNANDSSVQAQQSSSSNFTFNQQTALQAGDVGTELLSNGSDMPALVQSSAVFNTGNSDYGNNSNYTFTVSANDALSFDVVAVLNAELNTLINAVLQNQTSAESDSIQQTSPEQQLNQQKLEDSLVAEALAGSTDADAQAALLGYNPSFRQYTQPQMTDGEYYAPKDIYSGQQNYDNPNARFFNGASDATHREMVRQQYERN